MTLKKPSDDGVLLAGEVPVAGASSVGYIQVCKPGKVCAIPQVRTTYQLIFWIVAALVLIALGFPYVVPFFY